MSEDQPLPPPPTSTSTCPCCCCSCFNSCFSQNGGKKQKKFSGIEYSLVPSTTAGEAVILHNLPMPEIQKRFKLPQGKTEYALPLQLNQHESQRNAITTQPKHEKHVKRARSISEPTLPPGYVPDTNVFDFQKTAVASSVGTIRSLSERNIDRNFSNTFPRASRSPSPSSSTSPLHTDRHSSLEDSVSWKPTLSSIADAEEPEEEEEGRGGMGGGGGRGGGEWRGREEGGEGEIVVDGSVSPPTSPEVEFSLYYDIQCRTLMVHLQCAYNLPTKSKKVELNPIVVLYLLPNREDIFQSKMIQNSANPMFNQSFEFSGLLPDEIRRQMLVFRVFSHSSKGDLLGGVGISLSEADLFGVMYRRAIDTDVEKLKLVSRGDMLISLTHNPATKKLQGLLLKATNLQKQDIVGLADPYVKIWLLKKGRRHQKWKSKVKRNTLIPIFNEPFQFDLSELNPREVVLEVLMMDYDRFSRNDVVGVVYIGDQITHDTGRQHWEQILTQPNTSISGWHTVLPITAQTERTTRRRKVSRAISMQYDRYYNDEEDD